MAVKLSASRAGRPLPQGRFLALISVRSWVDPRTIVRLEELCKLKNTESGIEPATSQLTVLQPNALPRAPLIYVWTYFCLLCVLWTTWKKRTSRTVLIFVRQFGRPHVSNPELLGRFWQNFQQTRDQPKLLLSKNNVIKHELKMY
jgi:hypothetical protein